MTTIHYQILADDQYEWSKIQDMLKYLKDCPTKVIEEVIGELDIELIERDANFWKAMIEGEKRVKE
jgi:hypothetical protein